MRLRKYIAGLLLILLVFACDRPSSGITGQFTDALTEIQKQWRPDKSTAKLDAVVELKDQQWQLSGETTSPEAQKAVIALADSLLGDKSYQNDFVLLPHPSLGDSNFALVTVSVAPLRGNPGHSAEQVDQTIMGRTLRLLKKERGWYFVQTDYDYLGWVNGTSIYRSDQTGIQKWENANLAIVTELYPMMYSDRSNDSEPVSDLVLNSLLQIVEEGKTWSKMETPDGRTGFVKTGSITRQKPSFDGETELILTARGMMGIPYLWGGNSSKGNDCSGFTQTVFRKNGIALPRDARQQALVGKDVLADDDFSNLEAGDLVFFGARDRITHVGISLGGTEYIHQGGRVAINSFDPQSPQYSPYRHRTLKRIKRISPKQ